ncbi:MAG: hypothetical protein WD851_04000 [Pirellulales bacterium]
MFAFQSYRRVGLRRLGLELLEPRMLFSFAPVERGWLAYDDGLVGNLTSEFSRDVPSVDDRGIPRDIDERRFGNAVDHAPLLTWLPGESPLTAASIRPLATGLDHDGVTPLLVLSIPGQERVFIFRGEHFELVGNISFRRGDLPWNTSETQTYRPGAAIVHHGLIVFSAERLEDTDAGLQIVGTSFIYTQDYGVSLERVAQVGGGFDVPAIAGGVSHGMSRGRQWAFLNPFPVNGLNDTNHVWFPWADYIERMGNPKGGQIGLFQAVRDSESGIWTVLPNRLVHEEWIVEDIGGFHAHTAAVTLGGIISHWGDVGYRNQILFHEFDLANYQTAQITTQVVYGGYDSSGAIERNAPQPVAAAPAPVLGEHFASGDTTQEMVLHFGSLTNSTDALTVSAPVSQPMRNTQGTSYAGTTILHLQWVQGRGYVSGGVVDPFYHFSPDGVTWAPMNLPPGGGGFGRMWIYGSKLLVLDSENRTWLADIPVVNRVLPLQIAPGGTNRIGDSLPLQVGLAMGNTRREVEFVDGIWRYVDDQQHLSPQPATPPFPASTAVYEVNLGSTSRELGTWWLQPEGETLDASRPNLLDMWIYNLGSQAVRLGTRLRVPTTGSAASEQTHESNVNFEWVPLGVRQDPPVDGEGRFAVGFYTSRTGSVNADARFLIAPRYFGELNTPPYPLEPLASGSNELEVVTGFRLAQAWSAGLVFQWPHNAPQSMSGKMPVASLRAADGGYLEFSVEYNGATSARLVVEFVRPGMPTARMDFSQNILRGDIIEVVLGGSDHAISGTVRIGGREPIARQIQLIGSPLAAFDQFAWASGDGAKVTTVNPLLVMIDGEIMWNAQQQVAWLRSTLEGRPTFRVNPYPGDFNFDGVVDDEDRTVWEANIGSTSNLAADANLDGVVNQADYEVWLQYLGTRAPSPMNPLPGDFDFNGIVNSADYFVWRDTRGSKLKLNADADRNGIVDQLDYDIWYSQFGKRAEAPPQPLPGDFNFNGVVTAADYTVWRDTFGARNNLNADADRNGVVDTADLDIWRSQFGKSLPVDPPQDGAANESEALSVMAWGDTSPASTSRSTRPATAVPAANSSLSNAKELLILDAAYAAIDSQDEPAVTARLRIDRFEDSARNLAFCASMLNLAVGARTLSAEIDASF